MSSDLPPPPPYFESMPVIPPELIIVILKFASESPILDDPYQRFKWPQVQALFERVTLLRSASLVAREWTRPAQSLLWERIYLNPSRAMNMLARGAPLGQFATREVLLEPELEGNADRDDPCMEVLSQLVGVSLLCVCHQESEELPLLPYFALPNLSTVTEIDIRHADAGCADLSDLMSLTPRLTRLSLRTPTSPSIVQSLIPITLGTLTHLHINLLKAPGLDQEVFTSIALLEAVAPQLISLDISHYTNRLGQRIDLVRVLKSCERLEYLALPFDRHVDPDSHLHVAPLRAIPPSVRHLKTQDYFPLRAVTLYLNERNSTVEHVEVAPIPGTMRAPDTLNAVKAEHVELEEKCRELGIKYSVSEKNQQPI